MKRPSTEDSRAQRRIREAVPKVRQMIKTRQDNYRKTTKGKLAIRKRKLKHDYDMTLEDYDFLVAEQAGRCAICGQFSEKLDVDHCHISKRVRGLLCRNCNVGIGHLRESLVILEKAIEYLRKDKEVGAWPKSPSHEEKAEYATPQKEQVVVC